MKDTFLYVRGEIYYNIIGTKKKKKKVLSEWNHCKYFNNYKLGNKFYKQEKRKIEMFFVIKNKYMLLKTYTQLLCRGVFRTHSKIDDWDFLQKYLTAKSY